MKMVSSFKDAQKALDCGKNEWNLIFLSYWLVFWGTVADLRLMGLICLWGNPGKFSRDFCIQCCIKVKFEG